MNLFWNCSFGLLSVEQTFFALVGYTQDCENQFKVIVRLARHR